FAATLDVVAQARFAGAFTFQYSRRPGTPAADMPGQVPPAVVAERYERLTALVTSIAAEQNAALAGRQVEVLVAEGEGRKDGVTHRASGRARGNRLVHFAPAGTDPRPGDVVTTVVTHSAPHYLIADSPPLAVRRTRGGDAWQAAALAAQSAQVPVGAAAPTGNGGTPVLLGMPAVGSPAVPAPAAPGAPAP